MQRLFDSSFSIIPRVLCTFPGSSASSQGLAHGRLAPGLTWALQWPSYYQSNSDAPCSVIVYAPVGCRAIQTSATSSSDDAVAFHSVKTTATIHSHRYPLLFDGSRGADPGEPRYTAPYWIPADVREANHLPKVLFTDPWPSHDEPEIRRRHAHLCYDLLLHSSKPLTAEQVRDAVNDRIRELQQRHAAFADTNSDNSGARSTEPPPLLATTAYAKQLLEHMRRTRVLFGKKNPDSMLSGGHPEHPRLYFALKYQAERFGNPKQLAEEDAARREKRVQQAFKRLRHGKPPYAIHRRRAYFSLWQHEMAQEALREEGLLLP